MKRSLAATVFGLTLAGACVGVAGEGAVAPGEAGSLLRPCPPRPNCVSTQASDPQHRMDAIRFEGGVEAAQGRLLAVLRATPRTTVIVERPGYLAVEFKSQAFGFVDEAEFRIDAKDGVIRFRSGARTGYSDFGVNRSRMEQIAEAFMAAR